MEDGKLLLQVNWVGYDLPTWIESEELNAHPQQYDFISEALQGWVVVRYNALKQEKKRKRQQEKQQQQRVTRSRSAADSGGSSSENPNPLLEDGYGPST
jgi:hypothetical protein